MLTTAGGYFVTTQSNKNYDNKYYLDFESAITRAHAPPSRFMLCIQNNGGRDRGELYLSPMAHVIMCSNIKLKDPSMAHAPPSRYLRCLQMVAGIEGNCSGLLWHTSLCAATFC